MCTEKVPGILPVRGSTTNSNHRAVSVPVCGPAGYREAETQNDKVLPIGGVVPTHQRGNA